MCTQKEMFFVPSSMLTCHIGFRLKYILYAKILRAQKIQYNQ